MNSEWTAQDIIDLADHLESGTPNWHRETFGDCWKSSQHINDNSPKRASNMLRAYAATLQPVPSSPYQMMFMAAVESLAEVSMDLGIPDEDAAVANGNSLILEAIERLKQSATLTKPADAGVSDGVVQVACDIAERMGFISHGNRMRPVAMRAAIEAVIPLLRSQGEARDDVSFSTVDKVVKALCRIGHTFPESQEEQSARFEGMVLDLCREVQSHFDRLSAQPEQAKAIAWLVVDAKGQKFTIYNPDLAEAIKTTAEVAGSVLKVTAVCEIPPQGWYCTRARGHEGPCAAWPNEPTTEQAKAVDDTTRLDALHRESWDLRCFEHSNGEDVGWRVIDHYMDPPQERVLSEVYRDDPRAAIDAAIVTFNAALPTTKGETP